MSRKSVAKTSVFRHVFVLLVIFSSLLVCTPTASATGGYPWDNAVCIHTGSVTGSCPNYDWSVGGSVWNPNTGGYGYRNCTDYVAWKVASLGVPGARYQGLGNANTWDDRAASKGLTYNSTPAVGSAAVSNAGSWGHVAFVESINGSQITVSEYNRAGTGRWSTWTGTWSSRFDGFVHFESYMANPPSPPNNNPSEASIPVLTATTGGLVAFARGTDGHLYNTWQTSAGSLWTPWSVVVAGAIVAP